jgi:hypothetical protein
MDDMMAKSRATGVFVHTATTAVTTPATIETAVEAAMEGNKDDGSGDSNGNGNSNSNNIPTQMDINLYNIPSSSTNPFPSLVSHPLAQSAPSDSVMISTDSFPTESEFPTS